MGTTLGPPSCSQAQPTLKPQNYLWGLSVAAETKCSARPTQHACFQTGWLGWFQKCGGVDAFGVHFGEIQEAADTFFFLLPHHGQLGDAVISYSLADDIPGDQSPVLVMKLWPAQ